MKNATIQAILFIIMLVIASLSISKCTSTKNEYIDNIKIMNDTIEYYKSKNGQLIAEKNLFSGDIDNLKYLNDSLYKEIEDLKLKNKVKDIVYVNNEIVNEKHDTTYIVREDTISNGFVHEFVFNDEWRELEGKVKYSNDSVNVGIDKDIVKFDYTVAIDKNNKVYITSNNPYIKYNEISGYTIPKPKNKRFGIGPFIGVTYDIVNNKVAPTFGIGLSYDLIKF